MLKWVGCLALALGMVACDRQALLDVKGTDISHAAEFKSVEGGGDRRLALNDHNGRPVTLATFRGKVVVLFFGYTHCPDVCPTTLSDMAQALKLLRPEDARKIQVLFASVDPERDTPETLRAYVPYFHPDFLGLYGTPGQVARAAREFRVVYRKHVEPGATGYLVDHSAGSYVVDAQGNLRLYLPFAMPAADIAHDLSALLRAS
jgi:protein SCO1/2